MTDEQFNIIHCCQKGDLRSFGELYDMYVRKIYDYAYYHTFHKETAEDLTSQIFFKALNSIKGFDPDKGTFQSWLYAIARNAVIDHYRRQRDEIDIDDIWDLADQCDPELDLDNKVKLYEVRKYLGKLKADQREVLMLRVWQELSYKEISAIIGKSEANCKMIFSRTLRQLKQELGPGALVLLFMFLSSRK